jgi:hypothetical protein
MRYRAGDLTNHRVTESTEKYTEKDKKKANHSNNRYSDVIFFFIVKKRSRRRHSFTFIDPRPDGEGFFIFSTPKSQHSLPDVFTLPD